MSPTSEQIQDLSTTLDLIEKSRQHPVEMPEIGTFVVWGQAEFIQRITIEDPVLTEGTCGTAACLCGARALMDGAKVLAFNVAVVDGQELSRASDWMRWGAERFGIDQESAEVLFAFDNTMRQLRYYVAEIAAGNLPLSPVMDFDLELDGWEE